MPRLGVGEYWRYDATGAESSTANLWWESVLVDGEYQSVLELRA